MPHIGVDLDAIRRFPQVGRACHLTPGEVAIGLLEIWEHVWRTKRDGVTLLVLSAFFPGAAPDAAADALCAFGFLEQRPADFRVKGAADRLGLTKYEAAKKGGAATAATGKSLGNLKKGGSGAVRGVARALAREAPEPEPEPHGARPEPASEPEPEPSPNPTASSQQPAASSKREALSASQPTAPKAKKPADPRLKPLEALLVAAYAELRGEAYAHGGAKDVVALKALLPLADDAAIVARWRAGLGASGWSSCNTLAQLRLKWNDLAAGLASAGAPKIPDVRKGMVRAEDQNWNHDHGIEDSF